MTYRPTNVDRATTFAQQTDADILSDLFGAFFAFHNRKTRAFHVARVDRKRKGGIAILAAPFSKSDDAINEARKRGAGEPVVILRQLPMQQLVDTFCKATGFKASDAAFGDFVPVSKPLTDKQRDWRVARRQGNSLELIDGQHPDRWAARGKALVLSADAPWTPLTGPSMFPFGNNFAKAIVTKKVATPEAKPVEAAPVAVAKVPEDVTA